MPMSRLQRNLLGAMAFAVAAAARPSPITSRVPTSTSPPRRSSTTARCTCRLICRLLETALASYRPALLRSDNRRARTSSALAIASRASAIVRRLPNTERQTLSMSSSMRPRVCSKPWAVAQSSGSWLRLGTAMGGSLLSQRQAGANRGLSQPAAPGAFLCHRCQYNRLELVLFPANGSL